MAVKTISELTAGSSPTGDELIEVSTLSSTVTISGATISAAAVDNSFNDSATGFVTAGFAEGDRVKVDGFTGNVANNIFTGVITSLTSGKMIIGGTDGDVIVDDAAGETLTISKWVTRRLTAQEIADLGTGGGGAGGPMPSSSQAGTSYTAVLADANTYIRFTSASPVTFTIPPNASEAFPVDTVIAFEQAGAGALTLAPGSGVTLNSRGAALSAAGQYAVGSIKKTATNTWTVVGDMV